MNASDRDLQMSSDIFVKAQGVGKKYDLFAYPAQHLISAITSRAAKHHSWVLSDVSLEARTGDFLGIVGRNGAGKSTLLEIVAGILTPSTGHVETNGRVAALLELGAGFNPDFTGRENVRLSGNIYGLTKKQMAERLPAIEAFAGIGDFIDRPVREYSSGMFARLAFSVSIHVDADILIVDEILSVGDIRFQQKCMKHLRKFKSNGIVLFVSHDEGAILSLCNKAIWLLEGKTVEFGEPKKVMHAYRKYLSSLDGNKEGFQEQGLLKNKDENTQILKPLLGSTSDEADSFQLFFDFDKMDCDTRSHILGQVGIRASEENGSLKGGEDIVLHIECGDFDTSSDFVAFALRDRLGQVLFARDSRNATLDMAKTNGSSRYWVNFDFRLPFLPSGNYAFDVALVRQESGELICIDREDSAVTFSILSKHISGGLSNVAMLDKKLWISGDSAR